MAPWRKGGSELAQLGQHLVAGLDGLGVHLVGALRLDHVDQFLDDIHVRSLEHSAAKRTAAFLAGGADLRRARGLRLDKQQQDNEAIPVYKSRNTLLFAQLPEQFTLFDASRERGDGASRETIRKMISRWTKRGLCKKLKGGDTEIWQKLTLSA